MELNVNGAVIAIGQLGPGFMILRDPKDYPPTNAEIALWIDGEERRWQVHLPDGISPGTLRTRIA
jgi:hypothetical protein